MIFVCTVDGLLNIQLVFPENISVFILLRCDFDGVYTVLKLIEAAHSSNIEQTLMTRVDDLMLFLMIHFCFLLCDYIIYL